MGSSGRPGRTGRGGTPRGGGTSNYIDYASIGCFHCENLSHFKESCPKLPSECKCMYCKTMGHVTEVCIKKKRQESANMAESKPEKKEEKEKVGEDRRGGTPPAGGRDFSRVRQANLVTVTYLKDERNVSHKLALSSYQLVATNNATDSVKVKLRNLACTLERKEKGGKVLRIDAVTDPGATASLLSWNNEKALQCNVWEAVDVCISTANGASLDLRGQTDIWLATHSGKKLIHCYVVGDLAQELLVSMDDCELLGLLPKNWPNQDLGKSSYSKLYQANNVQVKEKKEEEVKEDNREKSQVDLTELASCLWSDTDNVSLVPDMENLPIGLQSLIKEYEDVFSDQIGDRPMDVEPMKLVVDESIPKPPKTTMCRPIPIHWQRSGEQILLDLLQTGIVKRVTEPCDFISPSFFVKKGDGSGSPRLVLDFKHTLNPALVRVQHPLPAPMTVWAKVKPGSTHFLSVDLKNAYWQLPLAEESQKLTAFYSQLGVLAWSRLPMGASIAPEVFNREVDIALAGNPKLS